MPQDRLWPLAGAMKSAAAFVFAFFAYVCSAAAQYAPPVFPPNTVFGRLSPGSPDGQGEAIPLSSLATALGISSVGNSPLNVINLTGAAGDGVSDDTAAVTAALSSCSSAGGGWVVPGPHRYLINSANLMVPSGCVLFCPAPLQGRSGAVNFGTLPYSFILNPSFSITMANNSGWYGCSLISKPVAQSTAWSDLPTPTLRDLLNLGAAFSGVGISWSASDVTIRDALIAGFATGLNGTAATARTRLDHVNLDDTACLHMDNSHDISRLSHVECWPFVTTNYSNSFPTFAISNIANNGSGLYRVTLSSATSIPQTGDTVWISNGFTGPQSVQANHWTITFIDTTHIDLQGSAGTGSVTPTGNVTSGSFVISNMSSMRNVGRGETITGTGIPGATTVTWVSPSGNDIGISNAATATNTGVTLTITDTAYSSGGTVNYDANYRTGIGFEFQNSEGIESNDLFQFDHSPGFHLGTGMAWFGCVNCWNDGQWVDNTYRGILVDGTSKGTTWAGGRLNGETIVVNSTAALDPHIFTGVQLDALANPNNTPMIEVDQGAAIFNGLSSNNGSGFYLIKDAVTQVVDNGNNLQGSFQFETTNGQTKLSTSVTNLTYALTQSGIGAPAGTMANYVAGDSIVLSCTGVTFTSSPRVAVTSVSGGAVTQSTLVNPGSTSGIIPSTTVNCSQQSTSGTGTGFQMTATLGVVASYVTPASLLNGGSTSTNGNFFLNFNSADPGWIGVGGAENVFVGTRAGMAFTGASSANTVLGMSSCGGIAGTGAAGVSNNTCVGNDAGRNAQTANFTNNVLIGQGAGRNLQNNDTTCVGTQSCGTNNTNSAGALSGAANSVYGFGAMGGANTTSSANNNIFGAFAGNALTTGSGNSFFGFDAGNKVTTGGNNLILGNNAGHTTITTGQNNILLSSGANGSCDFAASGTSDTFAICASSGGGTNYLMSGSLVSGSLSLTLNSTLFAPSLGTTPGGKQPVCIDTTTHQVYAGTGGAC